jgi:hypothetical protein
MARLPITIQGLEPSVPSNKAREKQQQARFTKIELPPRSGPAAADHTTQLAVTWISDLRYAGNPGLTPARKKMRYGILKILKGTKTSER